MFGLGRRKDDEARRLQALTQELEEANQRAEKAESQAAFLASQNRALAAKVHRLALQRVELLNDKDRVERENKELHVSNLQLEQEAHVAKAAKADAWQVTNLKTALRQQATQHETKMASLKRRTKALLTAILPGGHHGREEGFGLLDGDPGSPTSSDGEVGLDDLWDAPLTLTAASAPDVNSRVRDIIGCLYDDSISEEAALEQMLALTQKLTLTAQQQQHQTAAATDAGCSPLPVPRLAAEDAAAGKVDAGTDAQTARPRLMADVATETPAEISYIGTPRDASAAPSQGPASPRRLGGGPAVPVLDLAALVAQAMEAAPLSGRSTASTSVSAAGGPSFSAISQFVLAQPEKLQRLILRHAAATNAKATQSGFGQPRVAQSPYGGGLLPSAAAAGVAAGTGDLYSTASGSATANLMDPTTQQFSSAAGSTSARPSLTSRLLGLGSSNVANRTPPPATLQAAAPGGGNNAAASGGAISGVTVSPAKAAKRAGGAGAVPKFAKLDGAVPAAPSQQPSGPMVSVPGIKGLLPSQEGYGSGLGNSTGGGKKFKLGSGLPGAGTGAADLDSDLKELSLGGSSALAFFKPGGGSRA